MEELVTRSPVFATLALLFALPLSVVGAQEAKWDSGDIVSTPVDTLSPQYEEGVQRGKGSLADVVSSSGAQWSQISVFLVHSKANPQDRLVLCGKVNAKDSVGTYRGAKEFVVDVENDHVWLEDSEADGPMAVLDHAQGQMFEAKACHPGMVRTEATP